MIFEIKLAVAKKIVGGAASVLGKISGEITVIGRIGFYSTSI
jgi:hypothetical protein